MATLHSVVDSIKTVIKIGIIFLFVVLFIVLLLKMKDLLFPAQKPSPEKKFGTLPAVQFPPNVSNTKFTYVLDTITGELPTLPDRTKVYKIEGPQPGLLASQKASERLSNAGFSEGPIPVSETTYKWSNLTPPERTILYDILSFNFELTSDYTNDALVVAAARLGSEEEAKEVSLGFLEEIGSAPTDLDNEKAKTTLFTIQGNSLAPATSLSTAQIIRVDFFQKDIDGLPIVYPAKDASTMQLFVGSGSFLSEVLSGYYFHQNISESASEYPLISSQVAFSALKKADAYIVSSPKQSQTIAIKKVYLGYYLGDTNQEYLYPVVVFEAENGFLAYVPAVNQ